MEYPETIHCTLDVRWNNNTSWNLTKPGATLVRFKRTYRVGNTTSTTPSCGAVRWSSLWLVGNDSSPWPAPLWVAHSRRQKYTSVPHYLSMPKIEVGKLKQLLHLRRLRFSNMYSQVSKITHKSISTLHAGAIYEFRNAFSKTHENVW